MSVSTEDQAHRRAEGDEGLPHVEDITLDASAYTLVLVYDSGDVGGGEWKTGRGRHCDRWAPAV